MNPSSQRIAIAQACGWRLDYTTDRICLYIYSPDGRTWAIRRNLRSDEDLLNDGSVVLPDYLSDLNAMHEAWLTLSARDKVKFYSELFELCKPANYNGTSAQITEHLSLIPTATASQRAKALLRTLNLWTEND